MEVLEHVHASEVILLEYYSFFVLCIDDFFLCSEAEGVVV
jgi:hypothetical protein